MRKAKGVKVSGKGIADEVSDQIDEMNAMIQKDDAAEAKKEAEEKAAAASSSSTSSSTAAKKDTPKESTDISDDVF